MFAAASIAHVRWLYEVTPSGLGVFRAWRTAVRAIVPWSFWGRVTTRERVSWFRLALWLPILLAPVYAAFLALNICFEHLCHGDWVPKPWDWRLEFFAPFMFDAGETAPTGRSEPLWFPNRQALGLALGAVTPALMLLLMPSTRAAARIRPAHLARIAVYGQLPLVSVFFWTAFSMLVAVNGEIDFGIRIGRGFYRWWGLVASVEGYALVAWLPAWWYFAVVRGLNPPRARLIGGVSALVAILTVAVCVLGYWRFWYFTVIGP